MLVGNVDSLESVGVSVQLETRSEFATSCAIENESPLALEVLSRKCTLRVADHTL